MRRGWEGVVPTVWALIGVSTLFAWAVYRLGSRGIETVQGGLRAGEWVVLGVLVVAFGIGEGFVALERRWVPQLVERARRLRHDRRLVMRVLAPFYGMALIGTRPEELLRGRLGTGAIVCAILLVRTFPEPWRGIVDLSVAVALAWGLVAILRRVLPELP